MTSSPPWKREERRGQGRGEEGRGGYSSICRDLQWSSSPTAWPHQGWPRSESHYQGQNQMMNVSFFLGSDRHGASIISLGNLLQCPATELWSAIQWSGSWTRWSSKSLASGTILWCGMLFFCSYRRQPSNFPTERVNTFI